MIGLSRLKRAIEDVPTGGMQTGDPKVRLKLCDAQRIEVEFNAIIAERDNALAQSAKLMVQITDAFGDGYYDGFVDGAKHQDSVDLNTKSQSGLAQIQDDALRCSEIAEGEKSKRLGVVGRQELVAQVEAYRATLEYFVSQEFEWNNPNDSITDDIHQLLEITPTKHLRDRDAEVIMAAAKFHEEKYGDRHFAFGDSLRHYAEKVRSGEV